MPSGKKNINLIKNLIFYFIPTGKKAGISIGYVKNMA
jgi:hypothetical protein